MDTIRGNFEGLICSDCGEKGCEFQHWGDLVPKGETGKFCAFCWNERNEAYDQGELPKPLGVKPPGLPKEFLGKPLMVTTSSGAVYMLGLGGNEQNPPEVIVCCEVKALHFVRAKVMRLELGKEFWLLMYDEEGGLWRESPVVSIEPDVFVGANKE